MNRLSNEKSPYLLQHANNPVDWFPWGEEAFQKAKSENKPIFLSIGYSTCHWCHVMERESFENESVAKIMNEKFVNIKVDREERPDVDKVYMAAVQMMVGSGGWPLSVFLTPDLKPFYGGTYFPPTDGHGRPSFTTLLNRIHDVWQSERENIIQSGEELIHSLQQRQPVDTKDSEIEELLLKRTYHQLAAGYDPKFAGFGTGPKFPRPVVLNFLFRYFQRTKEQEALSMSLTTLMAMANGGMYDHLGGGFHRYSVDGQWRVPHFEKMLYDQAQLIHSFLDAYQITHEDYFAQIAHETCSYIMRDMASPDGGFFSAEDADSADAEHPGYNVEGAFYVWEKSEIESILTKDEAKVFCHYYSVEENGNALSDPQGEFQKKNILFSPFTIEQTAEFTKFSQEKVVSLLQSSKGKLFSARSKRPRPNLDDKILTSWNGLMISALARASRVLGKKDYRSAAERAALFIRKCLYNDEKKILLRRFRNDEAKFEAHLDDYAFLTQGLLDLYEATFDIQWIEFASDLTGTMIALFWDSAEGGFFDTSGKDRTVLVRMKDAYDGAEPTGNSVAANNLLRLFQLTNEPSLQHYAEKTLKYFAALLIQSPQIMPQLMCAADRFLSSSEHVVVVSEGEQKELPKFLGEIFRNFHPNLTVILLKENVRQYFIKHQSFMERMMPIDDEIQVYYCKDFSCRQPITRLEELKHQLNS